ncbi:lipopolysaccharide/colanic/teichoic acid biosynthesis glycosyltransferase [Hydrogenispora ethanolica]|uniref:Lipopolysaccharide/colanic/teichoic acid biosynthesis glycosyltransferase n=1 Tax=Hydrogenispora ethanolica TaxID=1082276 RepID=A0A4R1SCK7_HYDET|nr:sugar transferase [Hydrogenispora ethanolica]TCL76760.1 lipopolysaccharide/colanic/teichoic acid biosynthesis glycosyltransferase [Hydrogenispora ethanolica]
MKEVALSPALSQRMGDGRVWYPRIKRLLDVGLSLVGLALGAPLLLFFGALIRLESKGPVFYKQVRAGLDGKPFIILKLRSMVVRAESNGQQWAVKDDVRATRVGRFIRKTKIDELPQLINVLRGEMSIVGPRPERPALIVSFSREVAGFKERLRVKPGLTGWAQVHGGYELSPAEKLRFDLYYIRHQSLGLDLRIIGKTFGVLIGGKGSW